MSIPSLLHVARCALVDCSHTLTGTEFAFLVMTTGFALYVAWKIPDLLRTIITGRPR